MIFAGSDMNGCRAALTPVVGAEANDAELDVVPDPAAAADDAVELVLLDADDPHAARARASTRVPRMPISPRVRGRPLLRLPGGELSVMGCVSPCGCET